MRKKIFRNYPISLIIAVSCVSIVVILVLSIFIATYTNFNRNTVEAVYTQTRELSTQIVYNYESYISTVTETSNTVQVEMDKYDLSDNDAAQRFEKYLKEVMAFKVDLLGISVYDIDDGGCLVSNNSDETTAAAVGSEWFESAKRDITVHFFTVVGEEGANYTLTVSRYVSYNYGGGYGILKLTVSFDKFVDLVRKSNLGENGHITIVDSDCNLVYTSGEYGDTEAEIIKDLILGSRNIYLGGHNMTVSVETLANTKWRISVFTNVDKLIETQHNFLISLISISVIVLCIGVIVIFYVSRIITYPIKKLENAMKEIENSDYFRATEAVIPASKEIESLTASFNKMMRRINELMENVIEEKNAQRRSELKALQNQINPHFLYNTLDSLVWLIQQNENAKAEKMVIALAKLFRISISRGEQTITVAEELEHVKSYLLIQSMRYDESFDYEIEYDEAVPKLYTMKLILQPIVENSIYHGLKSKVDKGHIKIKAYKDGEYLVFTVSDNGYGMRQEKIDELISSFTSPDTSRGVGLKNIYQRITMFYNGNADMQIDSSPDEGTVITVKERI